MGFATIGSRMAASLLGLFGALALGLATVGLYGVIAYVAGQRTREIGIRMALGAQSRAIRVEILRQGLGLTLAGIAIGLLVTAAVMPLAASQLYDVNPRDPLTLGGVGLVLTAVAPDAAVPIAPAVPMGSGAGIAFIVGYTVLQQRADDRIRGRTFAAFNAGIRSSIFVATIVVPFAIGVTYPEASTVATLGCSLR